MRSDKVRHALMKDAKVGRASHRTPVPRLGGVAVVIGLIVGLLTFEFAAGWGRGSWAITLSVIPVFVLGMKEDYGRGVGSKARLWAAMMASLCAIIMTEQWIDHAPVPGLSTMLSFGAIGIVFTMLVTSGFSHAFNLIDGLNGLATGISITILLALLCVGHKSGAYSNIDVLLVLAAAMLGFLVWNFPFGKIFLGDAGAYVFGHMLSWVGVFFIATLDQISAWAVLLVFFWPFADTMSTIARRVRRRVSLDTADKFHFHQVLMRTLTIRFMGRQYRDLSNPSATVLILLFNALPVGWGVMFWNDDLYAGFGLIFFGALFILTYVGLVKLARSPRRPA